MVDFFWGNSPVSFPSVSSRIKKEMLEFIQEENIEFISYLQIAKDTLEEKGESSKELVDEFIKIFDEIKADKLMPLMRGHDDGEKAIENFTTSKIKDKTITNEENVNFLNELTVGDLSDSDKINRLRGFGALKFGQAFETLPEFDADDFLSTFKEDDYKIDIDLRFQDVIPDDMDDYNSEISPIRFSYGKENITFTSPYTDSQIIDAKKEHLVNETNQEPDFTPKKTKSYPPRIVKTMEINILDTTVEALEDGARVTVVPVELIYNKNNKLTGKFKVTGAEKVLNHNKFIDLAIAGLKDRNDTMIDNRIYDLGSEGLVRIVKGNFEGAGLTIRADRKTEDDIADKFYKMFLPIQTNVIEPMLSNPLNAINYRGVVNFKTERSVNNSLTRKIERLAETVGKGKKSDWKAGKDEDGNPRFIESVEVMVDGKFKRLSVKQAQELEGEAWTNKDTKEKISNAEYMALGQQQRLAYTPNYYVITIDGETRTPTNEVSTTHRTIKAYRLKNAPEDAYAEKPKATKGFFRRFKESNKRGDFGNAYSGFKRFLTEEEGKQKMQQMEERQEEENKKEKPSQFTPFNQIYRKGLNFTFEGDFVTREEYEKLSDKVKERSRLVLLNKKRIQQMNFIDKDDYEPIYEERELNPEAVDEKGKLTPQALEDAKELQFRETLRQREAKRRVRKPAEIDSPAKFGRVTDKSLAVVTGPDYVLNPLVTYANIQDAFKPAILHIELVVTEIGEFSLNPMQKRRNDEMTNVIEDIRENLSVLEDKLGE